MKKLFQFSVFSVLALGFAACNDDSGEPVYSIYDEPAVVESVGETPTIRTAYGKYSVASLANSSSVEEGSLLWVAFMVDMNNQPNKELLAAQNFKYFEIDSTKVTLPADAAEFETYLADSYSDSIELAMMYNTYIDSMLFFKFSQEAAENQKFDYELVCNPEMEDGALNIPTLYIRSKKADGASTRTWEPAHSGANTIFGFEMSEYITYYKAKFAGPVKFNLKYKIGTDKDGKDVYRGFKSNPLTWNVQ
jgi:hypothetical protein